MIFADEKTEKIVTDFIKVPYALTKEDIKASKKIENRDSFGSRIIHENYIKNINRWIEQCVYEKKMNGFSFYFRGEYHTALIDELVYEDKLIHYLLIDRTGNLVDDDYLMDNETDLIFDYGDKFEELISDELCMSLLDDYDQMLNA